jgi:hypothetical protein
LQLRIEPGYFSPNKDALQDQLFLYPVLNTDDEISRWRLDIETFAGKNVARLSGAGFPALIKWEGVDKKGQVLPDGAYKARLKANGRHHNFQTDQVFFIDTRPPEVGLTISTGVVDKTFLANGSLHLSPAAIDDSPLDRWLLQIIDVTGRTVQVFWSSDTVHEVTWDGTDQSTKVLVPQGSYRCVFQAWDKAGNESAPAFADLTINVTPREMLEQALHQIRVNETPIGLIVQLPLEDLFHIRRNAVDLTNTGAEMLLEVAILINAYPTVPVQLDGYSGATMQENINRDRASLFAWQVYSHLIKEGNVKASQLTVRGRGRSPAPDRRSVPIPVLRNGVEVILEGNRTW